MVSDSMTREEKLVSSLKWFLATFEPEKAYMEKEFEKARKLVEDKNDNPYNIDYKRQTKLDL